MNRLNCISLPLSTLLISASVSAANVTIDQGDELFTDIGDFAAISGYAGDASNQGQVLDVLKTKLSTDSDSVSAGEIFDTLTAGGVSSAESLVFGYSANQTGSNSSLTVNALSIGIEQSNGSTQSFLLGANTVTIIDFRLGNSLAEAQFQIDLGYDFLSVFDSDSNENITISASLTGNDNGADRIFLSSAFTANAYTPDPSPVPVPASWVLYSTAVLGFTAIRKARK